MNSKFNMLVSVRSFGKLHTHMLEQIRERYGLSQIEITIISFLYNNPGKDTAGDIVTLRMLPKGNVSTGVESLIRKSLLERTPDPKDRRKIHLTLTESALPVLQEIEQVNSDFYRQLFDGFSPEEIAAFSEMNERIVQNANAALAERK